MGRNQEILRAPRKNRIVVLEDLNFIWDEEELFDIACMWNEELSVMYIADYFERDPDEIILALIHLAREERITQRAGGMLLGL
jgi:hypothetical protein